MERSWMMLGCALLFVAQAALAQEKTKPWGPAPSVVQREGKHFRVHCHFDTARLADQALTIVEPVFAVTDDVLGGNAKQEGLLDIHLYRGADDYTAADQRLTGGTFARNLAFARHSPISAHIAMQPEMDDTVFARTGLSAVTIRTLAHEAAHTVLYASTPHHDQQPKWVTEGLATHIADRVLVESGLAPPATIAPMNSTRIVRVQALVARDALPTPRAIITTDLEELGFNARYNLWWLFTHFLANTADGERLRTLVDTVVATRRGDDYPKRLSAALEKTWGSTALDAMAAEFRTFVSALQPEWDQAFRTMDVQGTTWTQMAFPKKNAIAWRTSPADRDRFTIGGSVEILYGTNPQMNVVLARRDEGFVSVAFRAGSGVTVFDYRADTDEWRKVGWYEAPEIQIGREVPFEIAIEGQKITLRVSDQDPLSWTLDEDVDVTGAWGVGAQYASAGIWRGVELR